MEKGMLKNYKIYLICPDNFQTGGIELIHQLCKGLNTYPFIQASIYYCLSKRQPIQPAIYIERYNNPYVGWDFIPEKGSIIVFPESYAFLSNNRFFDAYRKIIYWESWDFYFTNTPKNLVYKFPKGTLHLAQSEYAARHILKEGNISNQYSRPLTDFLAAPFFQPRPRPRTPRRDLVLYNPKKDMEFTRRLLDRGKFLAQPLVNLSTEELISTLSSAKVYIDFGQHPGKDRIPREAALCGCCVLVGKEGSAALKEDVNIPEEYKFEKEESSFVSIERKISDCFVNFEDNFIRFDDYRRDIENESYLFKKQLNEIVSWIVRNW